MGQSIRTDGEYGSTFNSNRPAECKSLNRIEADGSGTGQQLTSDGIGIIVSPTTFYRITNPLVIIFLLRGYKKDHFLLGKM